MRLSFTVIALALLTPLASQAQEQEPGAPGEPPPPPPPPDFMAPPPPPPPPPPAGATVSTGPINWEGLVDTYYMYNFSGRPSRQAPLLRAFDNQSNSFTLNYTKLAAYMDADPVGFRIDLGYGHTGAVINQLASLPGSLAGDLDLDDPDALTPFGLYFPAFIVQQAYATAKFGIVTLDAGKFVTSASDEVIETRANWNYSRSLLFNGVPFLHTGARVSVAVNEMISLQGSVVNGWNNDPDNNAGKTFGFQLGLTLPSQTNVFATTYIGNEQPTGTDSETTMLFDLIVAQTIGDRLGLSLNGDFWKTGDAQWFGVGLKGRYLFSDAFNLALRVEYLQGKDGGYGFDEQTSVYEATLTGAFPIGRNYEIRAELRCDASDKEIFARGDTPKKEQFTGLVGFLAWLP